MPSTESKEACYAAVLESKLARAEVVLLLADYPEDVVGYAYAGLERLIVDPAGGGWASAATFCKSRWTPCSRVVPHVSCSQPPLGLRRHNVSSLSQDFAPR